MPSLRLAPSAPATHHPESSSSDRRWTALASVERDDVLGRLVVNLMHEHGISAQDAREVVCAAACKAARRIEGAERKAEIG
jgi:hypothetical protein